MRYLVTARVKAGREQALAAAIEDGTLGAGSIAGGEYARNMECARRLRDGSVKWVEVCYCANAARGRAAVLGRIFRSDQSAGRARALALQGSQRRRALGLLRLRLHGQARSPPHHVGTAVPRHTLSFPVSHRRGAKTQRIFFERIAPRLRVLAVES